MKVVLQSGGEFVDVILLYFLQSSSSIVTEIGNLRSAPRLLMGSNSLSQVQASLPIISSSHLFFLAPVREKVP
jgi:hypothetical protein